MSPVLFAVMALLAGGCTSPNPAGDAGRDGASSEGGVSCGATTCAAGQVCCVGCNGERSCGVGCPGTACPLDAGPDASPSDGGSDAGLDDASSDASPGDGSGGDVALPDGTGRDALADGASDGGSCRVRMAGCCATDGDCPTGSYCAGTGPLCSPTGETVGVCKTRPSNAGQCWRDADCPGVPGRCLGARICPCGAMCIIADAPGTCAR